MAYKDRFFYIDEDGNKKKYVGKIISDKNYKGAIETWKQVLKKLKKLSRGPE